MTTDWERLSALTGFAFVVLIFVALALQGVLPDADADLPKVVEFFTDDRDGILAGVFVRFLAGFCFVWFLGTLRSALRSAEGATGRLAAVAFGSGLVFLAAGMTANAALAAASYNADRAIDAEVASSLLTMAHFAYVAGGMAFAWLLAATFLVSRRTRIFPQWLGWAGLVIGAAAIVCGIAFAGSRLELAAHPFFVLWILAASWLLLRRPMPPEPV